ncbi:sensor histidine kinase [Angustibacter sp. McL0619]|uniref:sensor histidine kinase n=1 Tax=Angustibacter sp. McL0619 TaxID=3415676 RepID=UPI003CEC4119
MTSEPGKKVRRPALRGVRGRSTAVAVLVVAVALLVGASAFILILQRALISSVQSTAAARAAEVIAQVRDEGLAGLDEDLASRTRTGLVTQVVDSAGRVVASSSVRASTNPLTTATVVDGQVKQVRLSRVPILDEDDPYLLEVGGVASEGQSYRVIVASPLGAQQESVRTALTLLVIGAPLLLLLVGTATWFLVGRTLEPVERIRRRVNEIGGSNVAERIPVPPSDDEIARLAVTMNEMLSRLDEAHRTQRRFVADASHELRSPLTTLAASVELASLDPTGETWQHLSPVMDNEIARMNRLVSDLLLLAKADEHSIPLRLVDVDLDDVVEREVRRLRAVTSLTVEVSVRPTRVVGDPSRLGQAVTNLTDNAARHARSTVRLQLGADPGADGSGALLVVEDDGPGVPAAERERVFERFVRLDDSRGRDSGGSGLGLAIARELVLAHGGSVRIVDAPAGGCRVEVRWPAAAAE